MKISKTWLISLTAIFLALVAYLRLKCPDLTCFNMHMARDILRGAWWLEGRPDSWLGPEYNYHGGRLPGPAFYLILAFFWSFTQSIIPLLLAIHIFALVVTVWWTYLLKKDLGSVPAAFFALTFFLMPGQVLLARTIWNPALIVPINLLMLMAARALYYNPRNRLALAGFLLVGLVGFQIHFSCLAAFVASSAVLLYCRSKLLTKPILFGTALLLTVGAASFLSAWKLRGIPAIGSFSHFFRLLSPHGLWSFAIRLTEISLTATQGSGSHGLSPLLEQWADKLDPWLAVSVAAVSKTQWIFVCSVFLCIPFLITKTKEQKNQQCIRSFYAPLVMLWMLVGMLPLLVFHLYKLDIPYRYALFLQPAPFLVIPIALSKWRAEVTLPFKMLRGLMFCLAATVFAGDGAFLEANYQMMARTGRVSHFPDFILEAPLRQKLAVVEFALKHDGGMNHFERLHGPLAGRVRQAEYDWDKYYGGLATLVSRRTSKTEVSDHYFLGEPFDGVGARRFPYRVEKLEEGDLPEEVSLEYFGAGGEPVQTKAFHRGEPVLPFPGSAQAKALHVKFRIGHSPKHFLNLCHDFPQEGERLRLVTFEVRHDSRGGLTGEADFTYTPSTHPYPRIDIYRTSEQDHHYESYFGFRCATLAIN